MPTRKRCGGSAYNVEQLSRAGVGRISVGGSFARAALGTLHRAGSEVMTQGTFTYASEALSGKIKTRGYDLPYSMLVTLVAGMVFT
jgi:2-methylisocitrate lyase-like PEP mutase family enzyme